MTKRGRYLTVAAMLAWTASAANAANPFMITGGRTTQPVGHYELCQRLPAECDQGRPASRPVELTRKLWKTILEINHAVNVAVAPKTDYEIWGREELWSYPKGVGDCEDYVLEKRRLLMRAGVPSGNLLITVVRQPNGDGHAVLTVNTSYGDFVLDNLEPRVLVWTDTEYRYLKRQSARHAGAWVSIDDGRSVAVGSVR
ncbi:transglutaminase-like cysteine peptidase [Nitratireductor mangrovi]|uniref:Transglutaminase-like cysteine peptidase n=1 Tax=Nitratireductor mangrovi TaxID=2599600 RepID=A0A5B8KYV9_9HYPH|nr:transglutaminase-like cysteine peptidase [Nitratireductor mangrovi]QDZ00835.1 transglutaminase-like cysteine peptidase [Nitratireductor mangrovi]